MVGGHQMASDAEVAAGGTGKCSFSGRGAERRVTTF